MPGGRTTAPGGVAAHSASPPWGCPAGTAPTGHPHAGEAHRVHPTTRWAAGQRAVNRDGIGPQCGQDTRRGHTLMVIWMQRHGGKVRVFLGLYLIGEIVRPLAVSETEFYVYAIAPT